MTTLYEKRVKGRKVAEDALFLNEIEHPTKGKRLVFDQHPDAPRGFGIKVTDTKRIVFVLRYFVAGRDRLMRIGDYPTWGLAAARLEAKEQRHKVDKGTDLLEQRREERAKKTFAEAAEAYCTQHADNLKRGDQVRWVLVKHVNPVLGTRKLAAIRRAEVIELVERVAKTSPRTASLALLRIKQVFGFAEDREWIEGNVVGTIKPAKVSRSMAPRSRARVLTESEIRAFWGNAQSCGMHKLTALALKLILATGQRPGEVVGMRWGEINETDWTIPASRRGKTGTIHHVPLTVTALALLEQAKSEVQRLEKRRKRKPEGAVFQMPDGPLTVHSLSRAVARYRAELGNVPADTAGHWTPHDLRRTARTGLAAEGVSDTVAEAVIGHTRKGIVAVYDRHRYEPEKRDALEVWERRLLRIVGDNQTGVGHAALPAAEASA
jgi:integrase